MHRLVLWSRYSTRRHDPGPVAGCGGEDAVIPDEIEPRRWDKRGQFLEQLQRFESDVGRAVAPVMFEFVEQATVSQPRQALGGDRRSRCIAAQALETQTVALPRPVRRPCLFKMRAI
jgi:hypothetical protein